MDSYSPKDCLVYSFGVGFVYYSLIGTALIFNVVVVQIIETSPCSGSLEFEDTIDRLNCMVAKALKF